MRAARAWHVRPTEYLNEWGVRDRGLAEGLLLYEQSQNSHGIPYRVAQDPKNAGFFDVDDSLIDHSEAAVQEWRKHHEEPTPGVMPQVYLDEKALRASEARRAARRQAPGTSTT